MTTWTKYTERLLVLASHPAEGTWGRNAGARDAGGLHHPLILAFDMPVSITRNLWVEAGIANGSQAIMKALVFKSSVHQKDSIEAEDLLCAIVKMNPPYCGPSVSDSIPGLVPIPVVLHSFNVRKPSGESVTCTRKQLALRPDLARTVHRAQGLTLDKVVVDLCGKTSFGVPFVALSRTRRLEAMLIAPHPTTIHDRSSTGQSRHLLRLNTFLADLAHRSQQFLQENA